MYFTVSPDASGKYNWRLFSGNHQLVAWSGENFTSQMSAHRAAAAFKISARMARYDVYLDSGNHWRWRAWVSSDIVASSGEAFDTKSNAERAANNVRDNAGGATGP